MGTTGKGVTDDHRRSPGDCPDEGSDESAPTSPSITVRQERAIQALLIGATDAQAAAVAGVSRETCCRWRHRNADFIASLNEARQDLGQDFRDGLRTPLPDALSALRDGLGADSISVRIRVAETLIRALRTVGDDGGPTNPEVIRLAWHTERSELELKRRFSIF